MDTQKLEILERDAWVKAITADPKARAPLRRTVPMETRALSLPGVEVGHAFEMVFSTEDQDRDHDVIEVAGWTTDNFMAAGGPILWCHQRELVPIAKCVAVNKIARALVGQIVFPTKAEAPDYPLSHAVRQMVTFGALKAGSVGFFPDEWTFDEGLGGYRFKTQDLLEHSYCSVPSNPNALLIARAAGVDLSPVRAWAAEMIDITDKADAAFASIEKLWKASKISGVFVQTKDGVLMPLDRFKKDEGAADASAEAEVVAEAAPPADPVAAAEEPPAAAAATEPDDEQKMAEALFGEFGLSVDEAKQIICEEAARQRDALYIATKTPLTGKVPA